MLRVFRFRPERTLSLVFVVMAFGSSGCTSLSQYVHNGFKVGPNYCPPPAPVAQHWIDAADTRLRQGPEDLTQWWTVFRDPVLDRLIACASQQSLTLREAGFRILQARALRGVAVGNIFPQTQNAFGKYTRQARSEAADQFSSQWSFGFNLAWELDFWGRFRRAVAAADAHLDASVNDYDDVMVTLLGDVASNYVQIRQLQEERRYVEENIELQTPVFSYWDARAKIGFGQDPELKKNQFQGLLEDTKGRIPQFEDLRRQSNDALCILLGMPTVDLAEACDFWKAEDLRKVERIRSVNEEIRKTREALDELRRSRGPTKTAETEQAEEAGIKQKIEDLRRSIDIVYIPAVPKDVAVGIPAQLLWRRPDVRRAERNAAEQAEQIGIAEADFYPAISINGTALGYQAPQFAHLFSSQALSGSIGPSLQWQILNYGRILNNVRLEDAKFQELVATYQQTVLQANAEVENGLGKFLQQQQATEHFTTSVRAYRDAVDYMFKQYGVGKIDINAYYLIARDLVNEDDRMVNAHGQIALGLIQVYRAVGGGWQMCLGLVPQAMPQPMTPLEPLPQPMGPQGPPPQGPSALPPDTPPLPEPLPVPQPAQVQPRDEAAADIPSAAGVLPPPMVARAAGQ